MIEDHDWDTTDNSKKTGLKKEDNCLGVFERDEATMMYEIHSGTNKDYYFTCSTKAIGQNFNIYNKVLIGDKYEESARERLRARGTTNPTKNKVACEIHATLRPEFMQITLDVVDPKQQPEEWMDLLKEELKKAFSHW